MPNLRSFVKQSPAIAISAAALVFAVGTGVSFATTTAQSVPGSSAEHDGATILTWHRLPINKGWRGSLKYAVSNGVVYLSGLVQNHSLGTPDVTRLPRGARPTSQDLVMPVAMSNGVGTIDVLSNGEVLRLIGPKGAYFVSLSGVSFGLGS